MFDFLHRDESEEKINREEVPADHDEVQDTISQFKACAMEIILQPYRETIYDD